MGQEKIMHALIGDVNENHWTEEIEKIINRQVLIKIVIKVLNIDSIMHSK